jgi:hypothetical protein
MRLTADEDAPTVISLPKPTCPPRKVVFRLEKEPLGTLTERATVQS